MMTTYLIDKGVPVPMKRSNTLEIFPFSEMQPGDSFWVPTGAFRADFVRTAAHLWRSKHGWTFITRKESDGLRVWRMS